MKKCTTLLTNMIAFLVALAVNVIASGIVVIALAKPVTASPLTYTDPVTSTTIHRITTNAGGRDNCLNFLATAAGASSQWSQDSQRIVYTRSCEGDSSQNGIYVYDLQYKQSACVAQTSKHWTYPTFDHSSSGGKIYYIDGSDLGARPKPYAIYSVDVPIQLNYNQTCPNTGNVLIDIRAESNQTTADVILLTKNNIQFGGDPLFATHIRHDNGNMRTIIFNPDGQLHPSWNFDDSQNPPNNSGNDGDTSVWSPHDPDLIFTNRGTSASNSNKQIGIWSVQNPTQPRYKPFVSNSDCHRNAKQEVAHTAWGWHPATNTEIIIGANRCTWMLDVNGNEFSGGIKLFGELHLSFDPTSFDQDLSDIRFVADEYTLNPATLAEPFLYAPTLGDLGIGRNGYSNWSDLRPNEQLAWYRSKMMGPGISDALKPFEPHPHFSPDGQHVLWQSNSLRQFPDVSYLPNYPDCTNIPNCGAEGGEGANSLFTDLYLVETPSTPSPDTEPRIIQPSVGSTLSGTAQTFSWSLNEADIAVEQWWLYVGTSAGARDIVDSGDLGLNTEYDVIGIPVDGSTVYARLWYYDSAKWHYVDSSYTAATNDVEATTPEITSPAINSELPGASAKFEWRDNNTLVNYWWLYIGSRQGGRDLYDSGRTLRASTSVTVDQLPVDGTSVYVRLWFRTSTNGWQYADTIYQTGSGSTISSADRSTQ